MVGTRHFALVLALTLAAPAATLAAQSRFEQPANGPAYDEGYRQGQRVGEDHGRRGWSFNLSIALGSQRDDFGYRREFGDRDRYRTQFRLGFERGYRDAFDRQSFQGRFAGPGRPYGQRGQSDFAFSNGYNDGYKEGLNDGRHRHRDDPYAESRYRNADHDYQRWYGPKDFYRANYRDGFRIGYERGYADGWRRDWR